MENPSGINGFAPWVAIHIKTGNEYQVIGEAVNCTDSVKDCLMVIYQRDGRVFVRKSSEFLKKFKAKEQS